MRDIEFRAIVDNDLSEWTYGYYLPTGNGEHYIHNSGGQLRVKPDTLGQYTGLKDRRNAKVFEGDLVTLWGELKEVKWNEVDAGFKYYPPGGKQGDIWHPESDYDTGESDEGLNDGLLVIGSIHQNKELLK